MNSRRTTATDQASRFQPMWWARMRTRDRIALLAILVGAFVIIVALVIVRPDGRSGVPTVALPPSPTASAQYPPGTRWYYNRSQWVPLDEQAQPQP